MTCRKPKVLVAMSGGVDSSVAAAMLVRAGYDVVGCFMRLGSPGEAIDELVPVEAAARGGCAPARIGHQGCCSINDAADAALVAAELGIPLYICNFKKDFGRIIDYFVDEYAAGRTPNPCVRCNDWLKFGKLHGYARQIGADFVASGHYARIERREGKARLLRAVDHSKDQSYVLFGTPRERLGEMLLPIGEHPKPRVREMARQFGLPVFDKPDSQEICFVPDNDYASLVEHLRPESARDGRIIDETAGGREVGRHAGQHRFTIGQRRGVGVALGHQVFVVGKDALTNTVTVGTRESLQCAGCIAAEANWLMDAPEQNAECSRMQNAEQASSFRIHHSAFSPLTPCLARIRYNAQPVAAEFRLLADSHQPTPSGRVGTFEVRFCQPQHAVAPGQAVVLYSAEEPDVVLGGGWIRESRRAGGVPSE
jgi:tRNA-specific 2-thiouridylase